MGRVPAFDPQAPKSPLLSVLAWTARQRPVTWFLVNVGNKVDPYLMRATGGRVKTTITAPTVLLTHTGAKSGKKRSTPLAYFTDGDNVILIASRGGHRDHPAWYHNALANPEVELWAKGGGGRYRATEMRGEDRDRLWALATGFYPGFARYQERAGNRQIPVIACVPQD
jgi:deazaflavin-dependent oxidoreductase (nitroreductase family)